MDFRQLEYFISIFEEGSISKAADKMFISQQGLSKAILALEKELDCRLYERGPKGAVLTEAGDALLLHAYQLLEAKSRMIKDMLAFQEHEKLTIDMVIGARFSLPGGFFKMFHKNHPHMELDISEHKNETCIYNLEHGKSDLAIVVQPERKKGYVYELMKREALTIVMPEDHALSGKQEIRLTDLNGERIAYHNGNSSEIFMEQCERQGIRFVETMIMPGMPALYQTCADRGILGLSLSSMEGIMQFDQLVSVPIRMEEAAWDVTLMYHESAQKRNSVKVFLDFWKKTVSESNNLG